jgi:hypothetical protein
MIKIDFQYYTNFLFAICIFRDAWLAKYFVDGFAIGKQEANGLGGVKGQPVAAGSDVTEPPAVVQRTGSFLSKVSIR